MKYTTPHLPTAETYTCSKGHTGTPYIGTDGFRRCRECKKLHFRQYRIDHPEINRFRDDGVKKWRENNPERRQAQTAAQHKKHLIKKTACETCQDTTKLEMHHPDYGKPLEVTTLCKKCHEAVHHPSLTVRHHGSRQMRPGVPMKRTN